MLESTAIWEEDEVEEKKEEVPLVLRDIPKSDDYTFVCGSNRRVRCPPPKSSHQRRNGGLPDE